MSIVEPITPDEVIQNFPDFVIRAVNELIQENYSPNSFEIEQREVVERINLKRGSSDNFKIGWLSFEEVYKKDWIVTYRKPDYTENFESYYTFRKRKNNETCNHCR